MIPWPGTFTHWHRDNGSTLRLIVGNITPLDDVLVEIASKDYSQASYVAPVLVDAKMDNLAELRATPKNTPVKRPPPHSQRPIWWLPGIVIRAEEDGLIVAAKEGAVRIEQIQPAGKKMMQVYEFLRGYPIKQKDKLG